MPKNWINRKRLVVGGVAMLLATMSACTSSDGGQPTTPPSSQPSEHLTVVVIGDSIAFGQGDCGGSRSYGDLFASALSERVGYRVQAANLSTHDGLQGAQLVQRVKTDETYRTAIKRADILIISILHNDTTWASDTDTCDGNKSDPIDFSKYTEPCVTAAAKTAANDLEEILAETKSLRDGKPTVRIVPTIFNDWIGGSGNPPGATKATKFVLDTFNQAICRVTEAADAICLDVYHSFNGPHGLTPSGDLAAPDLTHPSAKGHARIAQLLEKVDVSAVTTR